MAVSKNRTGEAEVSRPVWAASRKKAALATRTTASQSKKRKERATSGKRVVSGISSAIKMAALPSQQGLLDASLDNLSKIDHIVVLMMENRSFDHLMGYCKLGGILDVDGLTIEMSNSFKDKSYPVHLLTDTAFGGKDPCHSGECVVRQLQGNNGGFVADYAR